MRGPQEVCLTRAMVEPPRGDVVPPCARCGYDLRGLADAAVCPECGVPIARSRGDEWVRGAAPEYLAALHRGARLAIAGVFGCLLGVTLGLVTSALEAAQWRFWALGAWAAGIVFVLGGIGLSVGWWRLSTRDPRVERGTEGLNSRLAVRWAVVGQAALGVCGPAVLTLLWASGADEVAAVVGVGVVYAAVVVAWLVQFYAGMSYVCWLAARIPSRVLRRWTVLLMWLGPPAAVLFAPLLFLGPLIALALYAGVLDVLRRELGAIRWASNVG